MFQRLALETLFGSMAIRYHIADKWENYCPHLKVTSGALLPTCLGDKEMRAFDDKSLPANSFIGLGALWTPCLIQVDEINHDLFGPKVFRKLIFVRRFVAEDHDFGCAQYAFEVGREHGSDMRDDFFDVLAIGTG